MTDIKPERAPRKSYTQNYKCMACGYNHLVPRSWAAVAPSRCLNPACSNAGKLMEQYKKPVAVEATPKPAVESDFVRSMRLEHEDKLNRLMNGPEKGYKTGLRFRDLTPEERKVYFMGVLYDSPGFVLDNIASRRPVAVEEGEYEEECEVVSPLGSSTKE